MGLTGAGAIGGSVFTGHLSGAVIVLLLKTIFKFSGVDFFLSDLKAFYTQDPEMPKPQGGTNNRKERKQAAKLQVQLQGVPEQACMVSVNTAIIKELSFGKDFDDLSLAVVVVLANAAVGLALAWALGTGGSLSMSIITLLVLGFASLTALKVDLGSDNSGKLWDKLHLLLVGALGAAVSGYLLSPWAPAQLLVGDWGLAAAKSCINQITDSITQRLQAQLGQGSHIPQAHHGPLLLLGLALFGGFVASSLAGPSMRYGKLLYHMSAVPLWGEKYLAPTRTALWMARAGVIAPLLVVAVQLQPIALMWHIPVTWQPSVLAASLLLTALLQASVIHSMCQAWLNTGLSVWFLNKHSGVELSQKNAILKLKLDYISSLLCRTSVQLSALASISAAAALLICLHGPLGLLSILAQAQPLALRNLNLTAPLTSAGGSGDAATAGADSVGLDLGAAPLQGLEEELGAAGSGAPAAAAAALDLSALFVFIGQYYGWWACLVWSVGCCGTLAVYRLGFNST